MGQLVGIAYKTSALVPMTLIETAKIDVNTGVEHDYLGKSRVPTGNLVI